MGNEDRRNRIRGYSLLEWKTQQLSDIPWRNALKTLYLSGWETDDIDAACKALLEAWEESEAPEFSLGDFTAGEVAEVLNVELADSEVPALLSVAVVRAGYDGESEALDDALFDLDAFAYEYSGDD